MNLTEIIWVKKKKRKPQEKMMSVSNFSKPEGQIFWLSAWCIYLCGAIFHTRPQCPLVNVNADVWDPLPVETAHFRGGYLTLMLDDTSEGCHTLRLTEHRVDSVGISLSLPLQSLDLPWCHSLSTSPSLTCAMRTAWVTLVPGSSTLPREFCRAWWEPHPLHFCLTYWGLPT